MLINESFPLPIYVSFLQTLETELELVPTFLFLSMWSREADLNKELCTSHSGVPENTRHTKYSLIFSSKTSN